MTQAFNLAQLANNLNTSGQLDASDGLYGVLPLANGGVGASTQSGARSNLGLGSLATVTPSGTGSSSNFLRGDNTWASVSSLSTASGSAPSYSARAFVSFDATRNAAGGYDTDNTARYIYASQNVSSVVKTDTGRYTVNFTTPMTSTAYVCVMNTNYTPPGTAIGAKSTGSVDVYNYQQGPGYYNPPLNDLVVFQ